MSDTLVLSPSYEPIGQVGWQRAISLLFAGRVEVVAEYEDRHVRSVTMTFKLPSIIRFISGAMGKKRGVRFSKENVFARDKGRCQYCAKAIAKVDATYDHVVPKARGGRTRWENIVIACLDCNQRKANRTPREAGMRLVREPEKPAHLPDRLRIGFTRSSVPGDWKPYLVQVSFADD